MSIRATAAYDQSYTYHLAAEYWDRGWSVIPMRGKTPAVPWSEFQQRRPTLGEIAVWFGENASERFNIGIVTGRVSDLVVVDADSAEDGNFWSENQIGTPLTVMTGGGGMHFYYRYPEGGRAGNRTRVLARKLDIRGEGGLVVGPPSIHFGTGNLYQWTAPIETCCLDEVPFFVPSWIEPKKPKPAARAFEQTASDRSVLRVRRYISCITARSGENGHGSTYRATCRLKDAGLSPGQALEELEFWNRTNADPPWTTKELVHKVESVFGCSLDLEHKS